MATGRQKIGKMISQIDAIVKQAGKLEKKHAPSLAQLHPLFQKSAVNLLHYLALRHSDLRDLQNRLGALGASRLGRAESHVMASLLAVRNVLHHLAGSGDHGGEKPVVGFKQGTKLLKANTRALLGRKLKGSKARIMVTLPTEAASDRKLVLELIQAGMNSARLNCAHDHEDVWAQMIANLDWAKRKTGRACRVCMDLGGPKLRTGPLLPGPQVLHVQPVRDQLGRVIAPAQVWLGPPDVCPPADAPPWVPVAAEWLAAAQDGGKIHCKDARAKKCVLILGSTLGAGRLAECFVSAYIVPGTELVLANAPHLTGKVGELPALEEAITLRVGDTLVLHRDPRPGEPACRDGAGRLLQPAHVSCTLPEVFQFVKTGEPVLLDDGKIEGVVQAATPEQITVEITYAREEGTKLRADKGINLPETDMRLSGLTPKDREDLRFVARHADMVSLSFVNEPRDVISLQQELARLGTRQLGLIIKVETQRGFRNLPEILLAAMRTHPVGVMIARGDLAIEVGWKHLAAVQEEILWLCEAAHLPLIWATQVLETLTKKGRPSRAEITDAALAQQAECVMLNKGPHLVESIQMLEEILQSMEDYHQKKAPMMPMLRTGEDLQLR